MAGLVGATFVVAMSLAPAGAWAADTETTHEHNATETFHDEVPCVGTGEITLTYNEVEHATENSNGFHATFTQTGTFTAVLDQGGPCPAASPSGATSTPTRPGQRANGTFIFSLTVKSGVGAGTSFNEVMHFTGPVDLQTMELGPEPGQGHLRPRPLPLKPDRHSASSSSKAPVSP